MTSPVQSTIPSPTTSHRMRVVNLLAYVVNVVVTFVSMTGVFGKTNTELSEKYQTLVTPAGWAFSIWGIIFTFQGLFALAQFHPAIKSSPLLSVNLSKAWFFTCLFQVLWTPTFAQESMVLSCIFMAGIWLSLLSLVLHQDRLLKKLAATRTCSLFNSITYALLAFPFRLHLGWISCALIVNINVVLTTYHREDSVVLFPAAIVSFAALAGIITFLFDNIVVSAVAVWALMAINAELKSPKDLIESTFEVSEVEAVRHAAVALAIAVGSFAVVGAVARALCNKFCKCKKDDPTADAYVKC